MKGYIYIIRNKVNNKVYIGQTVSTLENRFKQHLSKSRNKDNKTVFYIAIREFGEENFYIQLLEQCEASELDDKERYYIKQFNSFHCGYNSTLGGFGGHTYELDEENIINMYETYGITYIAEKYGCNKCVIKTILIKNNVVLRESNNESKPVVALTNNKIVLQFSSTKQAWYWLIENYRDTMKASEAYTFIKRACIYGNTAFGYKWMYLDDIDLNNKQSILDNVEMQKMNKNNKDLQNHNLSLSKRNICKNVSTSRNKCGRNGFKCTITLDGYVHTFESMKDLAHYISILEGNEITDDKKLRHKAHNIKTSFDKGINYKGFDIKIFKNN